MKYEISKTIFNKETVLKVVYVWSQNFDIIISENEYNFILDITCKDKDQEFSINKFNAEMLEQQLREELNLQFGELRTFIYNKAFSCFNE
jgi:His-Xaa-Ser system protein HxsD